MFTVVVALLGSGNRSTRSPFASVYSVIPSTDAPLTARLAAAAAGLAWAFCCAGSGATSTVLASAGNRVRRNSGASAMTTIDLERRLKKSVDLPGTARAGLGTRPVQTETAAGRLRLDAFTTLQLRRDNKSGATTGASFEEITPEEGGPHEVFTESAAR